MRNIGIDKMHLKDAEHFTSDFGLWVRRKINKPFKKLCNIFTNANIMRVRGNKRKSDDEYFASLGTERVPNDIYNIQEGKTNIVLERYPKLEEDESYIFVCNHTCPEDIETVLNIIDRNAYLVLGSIETLKYNKEAYLLWLNGMIPFDILDPEQRKGLMPKMKRVIRKNSILIFPEGSHNYSPNKIINDLFDGPINLSLQTKKKIVVITMLKDDENNTAYIDVSNPLSVEDLGVGKTHTEKNYVKKASDALRDKMATAAYHIMLRHFDEIKRTPGEDIEKRIRKGKVEDAFKKLKWNHDVFDAEYLVKKTKADKEHEEVIRTLSALRYKLETLRQTSLDSREFIEKEQDLDDKDTARMMREHWLSTQEDKPKELVKRKK